MTLEALRIQVTNDWTGPYVKNKVDIDRNSHTHSNSAWEIQLTIGSNRVC